MTMDGYLLSDLWESFILSGMDKLFQTLRVDLLSKETSGPVPLSSLITVTD